MIIQNRLFPAAILLGLLAAVVPCHAAVVTAQKITNNADSGITSANTYTHKIDFALSAPATATVVNGVTFDFFGASSDGTLNLTYNGGGDSANNGTSNNAYTISDSVSGLFQGFLHQNGTNSANGRVQTINLSGLVAGTQYDLRIYAGRFGAGLNRSSIFTFDPDGAGPISDVTSSINQDNSTALGLAAGDAYYINYRYTAVAGQNMVFTSTVNNTASASWHYYALTNQVVPEVSTLALLGLGGLLLLRRRRVDL